MNRKLRPTLAVIGALLLSPGSTTAQTPQGTAFTYQGRLLDNGQPANGLYTMRFEVTSDLAGTNVLDSECFEGIAVEAGLFSLLLDFGPVFAGEARFMKVSIRPNTGGPCGQGPYTELIPAARLTPAPAAQFAEQATFAKRATVGFVVDSISTPAVTLNQSGGPFPNQTWALNANDLAFGIQNLTDGESPLSISAGAVSDSLVIDGNSRVGLGSAPTAKLSVTAPAGTDGLRIRTVSSSPWGLRMRNDSSPIDREAGMYMTNDGNFRVTTSASSGAPTYAELSSSGVWSSTSDERMKRDFQPLRDVLSRVMRLHPTSYFFRDAKGERHGDRHIGFTAQDVENEFPSLVTTSEKLKSLNYGGLGVVAIGAVQELKAEKDAEIARLVEHNEALERRLVALEALLQERQEVE